ncbi:MAG: putative sugar-binding lipoprotein [Chloroflexi bacterium]|nr:putative sugar-binding lipoprotein [Chloroflexota bacterium]
MDLRNTESSDNVQGDTSTATNEARSRKDFLGIAATGAAGAVLAGAGLSTLPARAASAYKEAPQVMRKGSQVTLTYYFGANATEAQLRQKLFSQFEAANPDIKIVAQIDGTAHLQKLNTEIAGGNTPDLMMAWELDYSAYAKRGVLMDLDQFIKNDSEFQHTVMSQQYKAVLDMFSYGGKLWVLPEQITDTVLFYNKDHVKAAGLKMPTTWDDPTWTWDKFLEFATKLTQKRGNRVTRYGYSDMWWYPLTASSVIAAANGGNWFNQPVNPPVGSSNLSDPKIAKAIQWYADLTNVHNVAPGNRTLTTTPGFQLFMNGKASMGIVGHWFYPAFAGTSGLNFDVAPVPIGPDGDKHSRTNIGGTGISISAKTKYPEQCWRFVKFWAGVQGQSAIAKSGLWVPALKNIGTSAAYTKSNAALAHATILTDVLSKGYVHSLPISTAWPNFLVQWSAVIQDQVWAGTKKAADVLPALDKSINAAIKKY